MKSRCYWSDSTALGFQQLFHRGADLILDLSPRFQPRSGGIIKPGVPTPGPRLWHSIPLQFDSFFQPPKGAKFLGTWPCFVNGQQAFRASNRTQDDVAPVRGLRKPRACDVPGAYAPGYTMSPVPGSGNDVLAVNKIRWNNRPAAPDFSSPQGEAPAEPNACAGSAGTSPSQ